ncbi:unnamed protein product [Calypogeia fissa]
MCAWYYRYFHVYLTKDVRNKLRRGRLLEKGVRRAEKMQRRLLKSMGEQIKEVRKSVEEDALISAPSFIRDVASDYLLYLITKQSAEFGKSSDYPFFEVMGPRNLSVHHRDKITL